MKLMAMNMTQTGVVPKPDTIKEGILQTKNRKRWSRGEHLRTNELICHQAGYSGSEPTDRVGTVDRDVNAQMRRASPYPCFIPIHTNKPN
ncbi:hypothetical protein TcWFU_000592 [Taenia crassiceps]|uniref:Uncharacterized protein n=1 Tax=Taenia crassiceps TaxID=6207 RepID=A0ABR4QNF2_9CEST